MSINLLSMAMSRQGLGHASTLGIVAGGAALAFGASAAYQGAVRNNSTQANIGLGVMGAGAVLGGGSSIANPLVRQVIKRDISQKVLSDATKEAALVAESTVKDIGFHGPLSSGQQGFESGRLLRESVIGSVQEGIAGAKSALGRLSDSVKHNVSKAYGFTEGVTGRSPNFFNPRTDRLKFPQQAGKRFNNGSRLELSMAQGPELTPVSRQLGRAPIVTEGPLPPSRQLPSLSRSSSPTMVSPMQNFGFQNRSMPKLPTSLLDSVSNRPVLPSLASSNTRVPKVSRVPIYSSIEGNI